LPTIFFLLEEQMKKLFTLASLLVLASLMLAACGGTPATEAPVMTEAPVVATEAPAATDLLGTIMERGYILISTDPNYEPQSFLDTTASRPSDTKCPSDALTTAEMQGFDVDVAKAIGTALGVETCFATPGWDLLTAGNWADKWDMSVGSMTITTTRQTVLDFSVPYYYTPAVVAVGADSGFDTLESLAGQALCAGVSTTYEAWLNNDMEALGLPASSVYATVPEGVTVVPLESDQECAQSIAAGRTDFVGYVTSGTVVDANLAAGLPVKKLDQVVYSEDLAAAFDKASTLDTTSLRAKVDEIFTAMHADGTLSALSIQWLDGLDLTQAPK
jgi:polar amino acid transport system substrate-binding protein